MRSPSSGDSSPSVLCDMVKVERQAGHRTVRWLECGSSFLTKFRRRLSHAQIIALLIAIGVRVCGNTAVNAANLNNCVLQNPGKLLVNIVATPRMIAPRVAEEACDIVHDMRA